MHSVRGNHHKGQDLRGMCRDSTTKYRTTADCTRVTPVIHDQSSASRAAQSRSPSTTSPRMRVRRLAFAPQVVSSTLVA